MFCIILLILAGDIELNPGPQQSTTSHELSIIHTNIGSLRNKIDELSIEASKLNLDVVTVSETWLNETIDNKDIALSGFSPPIRLDRHGHGGVAIYLKSDMICKTREDLHVDGLEALWVETKVNQTTLLICSLYRPPSARATYWELIEESIKRASDTSHKFIVLGDFNSDCRNNQYYEHYQLLDITQRYNLTQLVNEPTRFTETSARCIDLVLTSDEEIISDISVLPTISSDHLVPFVKMKIRKKSLTKIKRTLFNYDKLNKDSLLEQLSDINFIDYFANNKVENSAIFLSDSLLDIAKLCMPIKKVSIREDSHPWFNERIATLREEKYFIHPKQSF